MKTDLKRWSSSTEAHFEFSNFQLQSQPDFQWVNGFSGFKVKSVTSRTKNFVPDFDQYFGAVELIVLDDASV